MKSFFTIALLSILSIPCSFLQAQDKSAVPTLIGTGVYTGETLPLKDLPAITPAEYQIMQEKADQKLLNKKLRLRSYPFSETALPKGPDAVWQKTMGVNGSQKAPLVNFDGQTSPYYPPDCNGVVGPNHYMQTINSTYAIYNKSGTLVAGPTNMNLLFGTVTGSGCNDGDPLILYDEQASRWLAVEFSICGANDYMLIAVSTTSDPTGTWNKYSFDVADMPDYEKFGIWQDGYYMGDNNSASNDIYVFQRSVMLAGGASPGMVAFKNPNRPTSIDGFMCVPPADNDGAFAPTGAPGIFVAFNDDAIAGGADQLWIYELAVNWTTPASSTFSRVQQLAVSAFDSNFGADWTNIAQPGTTQQLDAIPQVIMNIPQYRNFGTYQTLVCCHSVDVDNTDHAGIRWYELRRGTQTSGNWSIRQQGTYAPDANSRWMGSIALNGSGKIGLGYSISSSTVYPGIRYTGQSGAAYSAGTGVLDIPETVIQTGAYSQTAAERWGDYSAISIDPLDDQTFWFTTEYIGSGGARKSKIASFKLANDPLVTTLAATAITSSTATLNGSVNPNGLSTTYYFQYGTTISYGTNTTTVSAGSGSSTIAVLASITSLIPGTTYHFRLVATNSDGTANGSDLLLTPGAATVSTTAASSIAMNSATSGGSVTLEGGSTVTARGVCWNTSINPVVTGSHTTDGAGLGSFTSSITGLTANTTYHVRAYATNANGTFYGEDLTFNTLCGIFTLPFTESFTNAVIPNCWSQLDNQGNGQVWQFGVITGYTPLPALTGNYAYLNSDAYGTGNSQNADLITPTLDLSGYATVNLAYKHYFRFYTGSSAKVYYSTNNGSTWTLLSTYTATSSPNPTAISQAVNAVAGSSAVRFKWNYTGAYGYYWGIDDVNVTGTILLPTVTTTAASAIAATTSTSGGNVTAAGSSTVTARGVCWATTANPIATGSHTTDGSGTGVFTSAITGLNSATLYHVRAYATNTSGTSYGSDLQFTTLASLPVISTTTPTSITTTTASSGGNVSGMGGATVTARGVCWATTLNPTIAGSHTTDGSGLGVFTSAITSLIPNTLYHVRAFATNSNGTAYGSDLQFTTAAAPTLNVTPSNQNVSSVAGNTTFTVTSNTTWTVVCDAVWCSVPASGTGNGPVAAIYTVNTSVISRTAHITVTVTGLAPVTVTVTQAGATPTLTVTPPIQNVTHQSGATAFDVLSNTNWSDESDAVWCTATPSGSGNGTITATYLENTGYVSRTAHITVSVSGIPSVEVALQQSGADTLLTVTLFPEGLFNGTGLNKAHNGSGEQFAGNIADQITIEIHSSVTPYDLVTSALVAYLNTLGVATVVIPASLNGLHYIVVKHRNSIETWSEIPVLFGNGSVAYDFTDLQTRAFGSNLKPSGGKFVFPTGDVNQDGVIDSSDLVAIDNLAASFGTGYVPEDLNGDGAINAVDILIAITNAAEFVKSIKP